MQWVETIVWDIGQKLTQSDNGVEEGREDNNYFHHIAMQVELFLNIQNIFGQVYAILLTVGDHMKSMLFSCTFSELTQVYDSYL